MLRRTWVAVFVFSVVALLSAQDSSDEGTGKPLPPGPMRAKVKAACTQCHNAARITKQHKTRQEWNDQLDKMIGLGADVPDSERPAFLNYLTRNFGPQKGMKSKSATSDR